MELQPVRHVTFPHPQGREGAADNLRRWLSLLTRHGDLRTLSLLREGVLAAPSRLPWGPPVPEAPSPRRAPRPPLVPRMPFHWDPGTTRAPFVEGPGGLFTYPE